MQKAREVRQQLVDTMKIQKMAFSEAGDRLVGSVCGSPLDSQPPLVVFLVGCVLTDWLFRIYDDLVH
jgi:hypothetical protein